MVARRAAGRALLCSFVGLGAVDATAAVGRLDLSLRPKEVEVGATSLLTVGIRDFDGHALPRGQDVRVELHGVAALGAAAWVVIAAGQTDAAVRLRPAELGSFPIRGEAPGYDPDEERLTASRRPRDRERSVALAAGRSTPFRRIQVPESVRGSRIGEVVRSLSDAGFDAETASAEAAFTPEMLALRRDLVEQIRNSPNRGGIQLETADSPSRANSWATLHEVPGVRGEVTVAWFAEGKHPPSRESLAYGSVRLEVIPSNPLPPRQGDWPPVSIDAVWEPSTADDWTRTEDLAVALTIRNYQGQQPVLDREVLVIPAGRATAKNRASIDSLSAQKVEIQGRWQSVSVTEPVEIEFPPPRPERLEFEVEHRIVRGLSSVDRLVRVRAVDDQRRLASVAADLQVCVLLSTEVGSDEDFCAPLHQGHDRVRIPVKLKSFGRNHLSVSAPGMDGDTIDLSYRIAWSLIGLALIGGLVGAGAALLRRRGREWRRALLLGVVAAPLALLLAAFDLFDTIASSIAGGSEIGQRVSTANSLGVLLVALLAGLASESLLGRFAGRAPAASEGADDGDATRGPDPS